MFIGFIIFFFLFKIYFLLGDASAISVSEITEGLNESRVQTNSEDQVKNIDRFA